MVLNNLRKISEKLIKKPVNWMIRHDISPNTLTVIGFLFAACAGVTFAFPNIFIYTWYLAWVPIMFIILAGYMDLLDGGVARTAKKTTKFGGFLDSTLDRISDSIFYLGFMLGNMFYPKDQLINDLIAYLLITTSILISYIRSRAENEGVFMKGVGLMERAERIIALMLGYIIESSLYSGMEVFPQLFHYSIPWRYSDPWFFPLFSIILLILCVFTVIQRMVHTYRWLNGTISQKYLKKHDLLETYPFKDKYEENKN